MPQHRSRHHVHRRLPLKPLQHGSAKPNRSHPMHCSSSKTGNRPDTPKGVALRRCDARTQPPPVRPLERQAPAPDGQAAGRRGPVGPRLLGCTVMTGFCTSSPTSRPLPRSHAAADRRPVRSYARRHPARRYPLAHLVGEVAAAARRGMRADRGRHVAPVLVGPVLRANLHSQSNPP